ncbi:MAG: hypothetical protein K2F65_07540, partial [Eubacterium sp.]|nr:hypothetical protein [Eubacterium sp.]
MTNKKAKQKSKAKLMKFLKGLWFAAIVGSLGMVLEASCQLYLPKIMGRIIDNGVTPVINGTVTAADGRAYVLKEAVIMIIVALVAIGGGITCMKLSSDVSQKFAARIRNAMFKKISSFSFKNIDEFSTASLTTRLTNDVTMIQNVTMMILRMLIRNPELGMVKSLFGVTVTARLASMLWL